MIQRSFTTLRDEKLRRQILVVLNLARGFAPTGALSGDRLMAEVSVGLSEDMGFESDRHFLQLCRDLVAAGVAESRYKGTRRNGEVVRPKHVSFAINYLGTQLLEEKVPPVRGIEDERAV